jgi:uncharacterized protein (DUF608 family)
MSSLPNHAPFPAGGPTPGFFPVAGGAPWGRRGFLKASSAGVLGLVLSRLPAMAGPFTREDFEHLVPADKKLSAEWIKSLFERGTPEIYRGAQLKCIGLPIGGICAGQLYLGGDGSLWHWDIFNQNIATNESHYAKPLAPSSPLEQGFRLQIGERTVPLNARGFSDICFRGEYPVGTVRYKDAAVPLEVTMEAFSPFIPLDTDDSSLPATVLRFKLHNPTGAAVDAVLTGFLENAVCLNHPGVPAVRRNRIVAGDGFTFLECRAEKAERPSDRPDIVFENWSKEIYDGWTVEGTAFGQGPILKSAMRPMQSTVVGGDTDRVVNSYATAPNSDRATGKLTSRAFTIERNFINYWIGGGNHPGKTCLNLIVDGKIIQSATGKNDNRMEQRSFEVKALQGKSATIEIVDAEEGPWGNIGVGQIVFSDAEATGGRFEDLPDNGTMGLALLGAPAEPNSGEKSAPLPEKLVGSLARQLQIAPGETATVTFVLTWFFPNLRGNFHVLNQGRYYASKFDSALAVARYVASNSERLIGNTLLWRDTWYDSTLPWWFLDRTFLNTSILATSTSYRFQDGRFWGWEGVGCCAGTCGHVWYYAQAPGRLFPDLMREQREKVDFAVAQQPDGDIHFRGESNGSPAIDAQAGYILQALREHQMSADSAFLTRIWPRVKLAMEWMIARDGTGDGIMKGNQHNTLDADWFGPVAWLSGVYLAALLAAAEMADEMNDAAFAARCRAIAASGRKKMVKELFDGEYFSNKVDPQHLDSVNSGTGCEIDQVIGQSWAFQVGLPRVLPEKETRSALHALWRYNFSPNVGPYREVNKPGRWYAMPGEAGLLMCTFPRADWNYDQAKGQGKKEWSAMYFNECMNGFEHQVAGHMIWEDMQLEGLAVERALHDRYNAAQRNPYNEVECGDHYARSMASYGVFLAACGFEYYGPHGHIGFAPRLTPGNFRAPFTSADGWGTFEQKASSSGMHAALIVKYGDLRVRTIALALPEQVPAAAVNVTAKSHGSDRNLDHTHTLSGRQLTITLAKDAHVSAGESLEIAIR